MLEFVSRNSDLGSVAAGSHPNQPQTSRHAGKGNPVIQCVARASEVRIQRAPGFQRLSGAQSFCFCVSFRLDRCGTGTPLLFNNDRLFSQRISTDIQLPFGIAAGRNSILINLTGLRFQRFCTRCRIRLNLVGPVTTGRFKCVGLLINRVGTLARLKRNRGQGSKGKCGSVGKHSAAKINFHSQIP